MTNRRSRRHVVTVMLLLGVLMSGLGARAVTQADQARPLWRLRNAPSDADFMRYVEAAWRRSTTGGRPTRA